MMQSSFTILVQNFINLFYISSLFAWGYLTLVLMEITICKDARHGRAYKLLNKPMAVRYKLFKRSLGDLFYRSVFGMFIGAFLATMYLVNQLWMNEPKVLPWIIFHNIFPLSAIFLFKYLGHEVTFFVRLRMFFKGQTQ